MRLEVLMARTVDSLTLNECRLARSVDLEWWRMTRDADVFPQRDRIKSTCGQARVWPGSGEIDEKYLRAGSDVAGSGEIDVSGIRR